MKKLLSSFAGVVALALSFQASAVPVTFDIASDSTAHLSSFSGLGAPTVTVNSGLGAQSATLSAGQTAEFDFFSIAFPTIGFGTGTIAASLGFDEPLGASAANGSASGSFASFFVTAGELTWTKQPGLFSLANGTVYSVLFENLSGVTWGRSVDVRAYLTLNTEPVPEPGTLVLLGLGMLAVMYVSRRQLAARKV
jgi:hypothetical protein